MFYKTDRLGLWIDGASFYTVQKATNLDCDYKVLIKEFAQRGRLQTVNFYSLVTTNIEDPMMPLLDWLSYNGYTVHMKQTNLDMQNRKLGNCDVNMAIDMLTAAPHLDHIVYLGAKRDIAYALDKARLNGVRTSVISTTSGFDDRSVAPDELRRIPDNFIEYSSITAIHKAPKKKDDLAA